MRKLILKTMLAPFEKNERVVYRTTVVHTGTIGKNVFFHEFGDEGWPRHGHVEGDVEHLYRTDEERSF